MNSVLRQIHTVMFAVLLLITSTKASAQKSPSSEADLKKLAAKYFDDENFASAYPLYSQLLSLYQQNPDYNFRFGACMLFYQADKAKPIDYLEKAVKSSGIDNQAYFYLGRAYHLNYRFDDAIKAYERFKQNASSSDLKKHPVDHLIQMCGDGKTLLKDVHDLDVLVKKELSLADYFHAYDLSANGGTALVEPDDFKTKLDKKKQLSSIVYLSPDRNEVYFASYGDNDENSKDIYKVKRLPTGGFSKAENLGTIINTPYDEDFPFYDAPTHTLYFSSKGHNSMGGYDIFKSVYNQDYNTWSTPVNMDFPINTPDDDILFIADTLGQTAYFASTRTSPGGTIDIYKVRIQLHAPDNVLLKGITYSDNGKKPVASTITVKNYQNGKTVGVFNSTQENGTYLMDLPNGAQLVYSVETPGHASQSVPVLLPHEGELVTLNQEIGYDTVTDKLIVTNHFEADKANQDYLLVLDYIRKKANLDVNVDSNFANEPNPNSSGSQPIANNNAIVPNNNNLTFSDNGSSPESNSTNNTSTTPPVNTNNSTEGQNVTTAKTNNGILPNTSALTFQDNNNSSSSNNATTNSAPTANSTTISSTTNNEVKPANNNALTFQDNNTTTTSSNTVTTSESNPNTSSTTTNIAANKEVKAPDNSALTFQDNNNSTTSSTSNTDSLANNPNVNSTELVKVAENDAKQSEEVAQSAKEEATKATDYASDKLLEAQALNNEAREITSNAEKITNPKAKNDSLAKAASLREQAKEVSKKAIEAFQIAAQEQSDAKEKQTQADQAKQYSTNLDSATKGTNNKQAISNLLAQQETLKKQTRATPEPPATAGDLIREQAQDTKQDSTQVAQHTEEVKHEIDGLQQQSQEYIDKAQKTDNAQEKLALLEQAKDLSESKKNKQKEIIDNQKLEQQLHEQYASQLVEAKSADSISKVNREEGSQQVSASDAASIKQEIANFNPSANNTSGTSQIATSSNSASSQATGNNVSQNANQQIASTTTSDQASNNQSISQSTTSTSGNVNSTSANNTATSNSLTSPVNPTSQSSSAPTVYSDVTASESNKTAETYKTTADTLTAQSNNIRQQASHAANEQQARILSQKADSLDNLAQQDNLKSVNSTNTAASTQFIINKHQIAAWQDGLSNNTSDDITTAHLLLQDGNLYYNKSLIEKLRADSTDKPYMKQIYLDNAKNDLVSALAKQDAAKKAYLNIDPKLASVKPTKSTVSPDELNAEQGDVTVVSTEASQPNSSIASSSTQSPQNNQDNSNSANTSTLGTTPVVTTNSTTNTTTLGATPVVANNNTTTPDNSASNSSTTNTTTLGTNPVVANNNTSKPDNSASNSNTTNTTILGANPVAANNTTPDNPESNNSTANTTTLGTTPVVANSNTTTPDNSVSTTNTTTLGANPVVANNNTTTPDNSANNNSNTNTTTLGTTTVVANNNTTTPDNSSTTNTTTLGATTVVANNNTTTPDNSSTTNTTTLGATTVVVNNNITTPDNSTINSSSTNTTTLGTNTVAANTTTTLDNTTSNSSTNNTTTPGTNTVVANNTNTNPTTASQNQSTDNSASLQSARKIDSILSTTGNTTSNNTIANNPTALQTNTVAQNSSTPAINPTSTTDNTAQNNNITAATNNASSENPTTAPTEALQAPITKDVFVELPASPYSIKKPIPINQVLPEGLVYKVQIGAFKNKIPQTLFKGLQPVTGERTKTGLTRYTAGFFRKRRTANNAQNKIRGIGFKDAFVVAYYNGKHISLTEAEAIEGGRTPEIKAPVAVAQNTTPPVTTVEPVTTPKGAATPVSSVKGVFYSVQVGAYLRTVAASQLFNLSPLFSYNAPNGYIRYNCGNFNNLAAAKAKKLDIIAKTPIKDAFVVAYHNGERISIAEAAQLLSGGGTTSAPQGQNTNATPVVATPQNQTTNITSTTPSGNISSPVQPNPTDNTTTPVNSTTTPATEKPTTTTATTIQPSISPSANPEASPAPTPVTSNPVAPVTSTATSSVSASANRSLSSSTIDPAGEATVSVTIHRGTVSGFAKLEEDIPSGFTASAGDEHNATFGFNNNTVGYVWTELPADSVFTVTYNLSALSTAAGQQTITGKFLYTVNSEKQESAIAPSTITVNNPATSTPPTSTTEQPSVTTTPAPASNDTSSKKVSFCVQVGEYSGPIPINVANKLLQISSQGIKAHKEGDGITSYTVGDYSDFASANTMKQELVQNGYPKAFVVAYTGVTKITLEQAQLLLTK